MKKNDARDKNKILIVEDDKSVRDFLERFLRQKGYSQIRMAETGKEALKIVRKGKIKIVTLDIRLPDVNGIEVLRKMKKMDKDISVIMITAFPDEKLAKEAMEEGACDYIVKPFDLVYLELTLRKIAAQLR